jgi:2,4-dienoyl-CoA reductase-like NADH-dependent reductase (Old Yellow Enzyme family)
MRKTFEPARLGNMGMKNRLFRAATGDVHAVNGHYSEEDFAWYRTMAESGVGAILSGLAYVTDYPMREGPGMLGIYDDSFTKEYRRLADMVHGQESRLLIQLVHCGSNTYVKGRRIVGPSAVANPYSGAVPEEMTEEDFTRIRKAFTEAALRAQEAGCDGVEVHGAHGYLLHEFLSTYYNRRTDAYGGSLENRIRFLLEICRDIREKTGPQFPVLVKINCSDAVPGITTEDFLQSGVYLQEAGVSAIEVSGAWKGNKSLKPYFLEETTRLAKQLSIPVILTGGVRDIKELDQIFAETEIQFAGMCRPFIVEPNLLARWKSGNEGRSWCRNCNACMTTGLVCPYRTT